MKNLGRLSFDLGWQIALPLVLLAGGGRWLDQKLDSSPWLLLSGIGLALLMNVVLVSRQMLKIIAETEAEQKLLLKKQKTENEEKTTEDKIKF